MDFSQFLSDFIKAQQLTNSRLAEQLQVPAATISHLLSGRNKPSLDFLQRLIRTYPSLDLYDIMGLKEYNYSHTEKSEKKQESTPKEEHVAAPIEHSVQNVKKIVVLYEDNTFEEYNKK